MSLTKDDVTTIQTIVVDAIEKLVLPRFDDHEQRLNSIDTRLDNLETTVSKNTQDIVDLRSEMRSGFAAVNQRIDDLSEDINAKVNMLDEDIKEIYKLLEKLEKATAPDKPFLKLTLEQKILRTHEQLLLTAKQANVTLPR